MQFLYILGLSDGYVVLFGSAWFFLVLLVSSCFCLFLLGSVWVFLGLLGSAGSAWFCHAAKVPVKCSSYI